jgi:hypothetical protein
MMSLRVDISATVQNGTIPRWFRPEKCSQPPYFSIA